MAQINMASIMSKVRAYTKTNECKKRSQEYIAQCRQDGRSTTESGETIITEEIMCRAAETMIATLRQVAQEHQLPASVQEHFNSLEYSQPRVVGNQGEAYQVDIWFSDDLSRMSLLIPTGKRAGQRTGDGIQNIVSLFDTGYSASHSVFGTWDGHEDAGVIRSRSQLDGKHFMSQAVDSFNRAWSEIYGVRAMIAADTEFYSGI